MISLFAPVMNEAYEEIRVLTTPTSMPQTHTCSLLWYLMALLRLYQQY